MVQDTNGTPYGTADRGGASADGTVFTLDTGLGPFVETVPTSGSIGAQVKIFGTNLAGATSVSFNGVPTVFKVVSKTAISVTAPPGATTGYVTVTTPSGVLRSNVKFQVRPSQLESLSFRVVRRPQGFPEGESIYLPLSSSGRLV